MICGDLRNGAARGASPIRSAAQRFGSITRRSIARLMAVASPCRIFKPERADGEALSLPEIQNGWCAMAGLLRSRVWLDFSIADYLQPLPRQTSAGWKSSTTDTAKPATKLKVKRPAIKSFFIDPIPGTTSKMQRMEQPSLRRSRSRPSSMPREKRQRFSRSALAAMIAVGKHCPRTHGEYVAHTRGQVQGATKISGIFY
jgi:hypothetical protein